MRNYRMGMSSKTLGPGDSTDNRNPPGKDHLEPALREKLNRFNEAYRGLRETTNDYQNASIEDARLSIDQAKDTGAALRGIYGPKGQAQAELDHKKQWRNNVEQVRALNKASQKRSFLDSVIPGRHAKKQQRCAAEIKGLKQANQTLKKRWSGYQEAAEEALNKINQKYDDKRFEVRSQMQHAVASRIGHASEFLGLSKDPQLQAHITPSQRRLIPAAQQWQEKGMDANATMGRARLGNTRSVSNQALNQKPLPSGAVRKPRQMKPDNNNLGGNRKSSVSQTTSKL